MNYFEFYSLPLAFHIDEQLLKRKFYEFSKKFHPDFYINEPEEKQQEILELSTVNNKAYQALSDYAKRVQYILETYGVIGEGEKYQLPQEFLMEMMDVNEALMELEFETDPVEVEKIAQQVDFIERNMTSELQQLTFQFDNQDESVRSQMLEKIKDAWYRQKYLLRIRESLNRFASPQ